MKAVDPAHEKIAHDALRKFFNKEVPFTVNGRQVGTAKIVTLGIKGLQIETRIDVYPSLQLTPEAGDMSFGFTVPEESR